VSRRSTLWALGAPVRFVLLALIGLYRVSVGQLTGGRCRFHPSCSAYAQQAIRELGVARGGALAVWRVLRCGPWTSGGVDYPPSYESVIHPVAGAAAYDGDIREDGLASSRSDGSGTR
jgi:putative membrane protein insertion efficiency factor